MPQPLCTTELETFVPGQFPPTGYDFLQRVEDCIAWLCQLEHLKKENPDLAERLLDRFSPEANSEGYADNSWVRHFQEISCLVGRIRNATAAAGRELAQNMNATDSLPVFRLVERVERAGDSAALATALSDEQPLIEAACARSREVSAPKVDKLAQLGAPVEPPKFEDRKEIAAPDIAEVLRRASGATKKATVESAPAAPEAAMPIGGAASPDGAGLTEKARASALANRVKRFCKKWAWLGGIVVGIATLVATVIEVVKWLHGR
jgi:hypothetical protein